MTIFPFKVSEYICDLLYEKSKHALFAHITGALAILYLFNDVISKDVFILLASVFGTMILFRSIILWLHFRREPSKKDTHYWYPIFLLGSFFSGLSWALAVVFLFTEQQEPPYQLLILLVAAGFTTGAALTQSADKLAVLIFTQPIGFAVMGRLFYMGDSISQATAVLLLFLDLPLITAALSSSQASFRLYQSAILERQMNEAKTDFLATMTHELRTPMNAVVNIGHLLDKTDLSNKQKNYVVKLQQASNSLLEIINNILDFSRIESGQMELEKIPFNLDDIMETVRAHVENQADNKGLCFEIIINNKVNRYIIGDPLKLTQILTNLSYNGIKFTEKGKVEIHVSQLSSNKTHTQLNFKVLDTGIGIKEKDKDKLFSSFTQLNISDSRKYGGTGLGLTISQHLLSMMNSTIGVESVFGKGSTFSFSIWFEKALDKPIENLQYDKSSLSSLLNVVPELKGNKVLLVDDDTLNLDVTQEILQALGLDVVVANSATSAFVLLKKWMPDIIFMDLQMPEISGYEAFDILRADTRLETIPIIALTANASTIEKKKCLDYGMNDFLTKPIDPRLLKKILLAWIPDEDISKKHIDENYKKIFNITDKECDSSTEIKMKLKIIIEMFGLELSMELFKKVDMSITEDTPLLIQYIENGNMREAGVVGHRLKGVLGMYSSSRLERLLTEIDENTIDAIDTDVICILLRTEVILIQNALKESLSA